MAIRDGNSNNNNDGEDNDDDGEDNSNGKDNVCGGGSIPAQQTTIN